MGPTLIREEEGQPSRESFSLFFLFSSLLFLIQGVSTIGICRAKNESSSTRRGLRVSTKNTGFAENLSKKFENS